MQTEFPRCYYEIWFYCIHHPSLIDVEGGQHDIRNLSQIIMPSQANTTAVNVSTSSGTTDSSTPANTHSGELSVDDILELDPHEAALREIEAECQSSDESTAEYGTPPLNPEDAMVISPPRNRQLSSYVAIPDPTPKKHVDATYTQSLAQGGARKKIFASKTPHSRDSSASSTSTPAPAKQHMPVKQQSVASHDRRQHRNRSRGRQHFLKHHESPELPSTRRQRSQSRSRVSTKTSQHPWATISSEDLRHHLSRGHQSRREQDEAFRERARSLSKVRHESTTMITFEATTGESVGLDLSTSENRIKMYKGRGLQPKYVLNAMDDRLKASKAAEYEIGPEERDDDGNPARPFLDAGPMMFHGHVVHRIRPGHVVKMRCTVTGQMIWLPITLLKDDQGNDTNFKRMILNHKPDVRMAKEFLHAHKFKLLNGKSTTLERMYNRAQSSKMVVIVEFLQELQRGSQNFDHWKVGVCPHKGCQMCVLMIEGGHFCRLLNDKWTNCHVPSGMIERAKDSLRQIHAFIRHNKSLPSAKDYQRPRY